MMEDPQETNNITNQDDVEVIDLTYEDVENEVKSVN